MYLDIIDKMNKKLKDNIYDVSRYTCIYDMDIAKNAYITVKYWVTNSKIDAHSIDTERFKITVDKLSDVEKVLFLLISFDKKCIIKHIDNVLGNNDYGICADITETTLSKILKKVYDKLPLMLCNITQGASKNMIFNAKTIREMVEKANSYCCYNHDNIISLNAREFVNIIYNK